MVLVKSSNLSDKTPYNAFPFHCHPDCAVFPSGSPVENYDASRVEFLVECKTVLSHDPFLQDPMPQSESARANPFMSDGPAARHVAGQITGYATQMLSAQYRTHAFTILVFKEFSRLIRWDRAGAIVTAPINHDDDPFLYDFLIRYDNASLETRGHDATVARLTEDNNKELMECARSVLELAETETLLSISIPDSSQTASRSFIVHAPYAQADIPAGRWTRTEIAYDVQRKQRVLLKDSWRVSLPDITPEGIVYGMLHRKNVPNIPVCALGSDIGDGFHCSQTNDFVGNFLPYDAPHFTPLRHYRLVLDTIGQKLEDFRSSKQMVRAVRAALRGKLIKRHWLCDVL